MPQLSLHDPLLSTQAIAAVFTILVTVAMTGLTVLRVTQEKRGCRAREGLLRTRLSRHPGRRQVLPSERLQPVRRTDMKGLERVPFLLAAAPLLLNGYVGTCFVGMCLPVLHAAG